MLLGVGSNWLVRLLNGGMPVRGIVYAATGPVAHNAKIPLWPGTRLAFLTDVLPGSISIGDVLLGLGLAIFAISAVAYEVRRFRRMVDLSG